MATKRRSNFIEALNTVFRALKWRIRFWRGRLRRQAICRQYFLTHETPKLQIGAGPTRLKGWLSTDIAPKPGDLAQLDATKTFPFPDGTFDYIYSEHMIEHISWREAMFMLSECLRVLKPGGKIRVATPDIEVFAQLLNQDRPPVADRYINWTTEKFLAQGTPHAAPFVINNVFYNWGHQFLYSKDLLASSLSDAGFTNVTLCEYGESNDPALTNLESHGENSGDNEMSEFETMVFEGSKPND